MSEKKASNDPILSRLLKGSVTFISGGAVNSGINFLLVFLYSQYISPADFGILAVLMIIHVFCEVFFNFGINGSMVMLYFKQPSEAAKRRLVNTANLFSILVGTALFSIVILFNSELSEFALGSDPIFEKYFFFAVLNGFIQNGFATPQCYFRILERSKAYVFYEILTNLVKTAFILYFVAVQDMGLLGILYGNFLALALTWILLVLPLFRYFKDGFSTSVMKELLRIGWPLIAAWLATWALNSLDRFFINEFATPNELGQYSFAFRIVMALNIILVVPMNHLWPTLIHSTEEEEGVEEKFNEVLNYYTIFSGALYFFLLLFSRDLYRLAVSDQYYESLNYIPLLAVIPILTGLGQILSTGARLKRKTGLFPIATTGVFIFAAASNSIAVQKFGAMGVAATTVASMILLCAAYQIYSQKVHPIRFAYAGIFKLSSFISILTFVYYLSLKIFPMNIPLPFLYEFLPKVALLCVIGLILKKPLISLLSRFLSLRKATPEN